MDKFPDGVSGLHSPDDFDLLSLGILPQEEEPEPAADDEEPRINPLHDMDSVEFLLWVEQEAARELERRSKKTPWKSRKRPKSPEIQHPAAPKGAAGCFSLCARPGHSFCTNRARMALSTARIITPTSAKMASHMLAIPRAPSTRHTPLTPRAKTMF